jgi:endoglucanase
MRTIGYQGIWRMLGLALALLLLPAAGHPPDALRRGVNITNWFRFPPSRTPEALRHYLDDAGLARLKHAGFSFIRLPVQPDLLSASDALADAIGRAQRQGLATMVALFAPDWQLETNAADRAKLLATWRSLALLLRRFNPAKTYPEVLNEPVFARDEADWAELQHRALLTIRAILPQNTIVLTGADWGSVTGLLALAPESDSNVVYSFHFYEPAELTALGAYRTGLDTSAMARLPFPVEDQQCNTAATSTGDASTADLIRFYCQQGWDVARVTSRIAAAGHWSRLHHVSVIAGEFGASQRLNPAARYAWLSAVRSACEHEGLGWALWGYDDTMGFGMRLPHDRRPLDTVMLRALGLGE